MTDEQTQQMLNIMQQQIDSQKKQNEILLEKLGGNTLGESVQREIEFDSMKLTEAKKIFVDDLLAQDRSAHTRKAYKSQLTRFIDFAKLSKVRYCEDVTHYTIIEYREHLSSHLGLKANSINAAINAIKVFFNFLVDEGIVTDNPVKKIKRRNVEDAAPKAASNSDLAMLRDSIAKHETPKHTTLFDVLYYTGLRVQELCDLKVKHVDLSKNSIFVENGKGNKSREIPIADPLQKILADYLATYCENRSDNAFLFLSTHRKAFSTSAVQQIFVRHCDKLDIQKVTPHTLRHTLATRLVRKKEPLVNVQKILGHSNLNTTGRYITPSQGDLAESLNRIN